MSDIKEAPQTNQVINNEAVQSELKVPAESALPNPTSLLGVNTQLENDGSNMSVVETTNTGSEIIETPQTSTLEDTAEAAIAVNSEGLSQDPTKTVIEEAGASPESDLDVADEGSQVIDQQKENLKPISQTVNPETETNSKPVEPEKKYEGIEAIKHAADLENLLKAYQINSEANQFNPNKLAELQRAMAERMLKLGHSEKAIDFMLLAGQTENNFHFQESVNQLADLIERTLPNKISNFLEALEERDKSQKRHNF